MELSPVHGQWCSEFLSSTVHGLSSCKHFFIMPINLCRGPHAVGVKQELDFKVIHHASFLKSKLDSKSISSLQCAGPKFLMLSLRSTI